MAIKTKKNTKVKTIQMKFYKRLVLNQYFLKLFGVSKFEEISESMKDPKYEGLDVDNNTNFYHFFKEEYKNQCILNKDKLLQYDENIVRYTFRISEKREHKISWKYFQYLSLLFTEIYLDKYFNDPEGFLNELNEHVAEFNQDKEQIDRIDNYELSELKKIAFWNATGSGKTLIMHINILQYLHYIKQNNKEHEINRVILLTPNEGLSNQHLEEFYLSGLNAELFDKNTYGLPLIEEKKIEIIDINKIKDESGDKTVAVDAFEGNNLVLVDEGHRGSSGQEWKAKRDKLCETGFSFEYSATFGQAMKASGKRDLIQEYAKCILFDYSYRYFYKDGYGKDYNILNMEDDSDDDKRELYLTACLLTFYQQKKLFGDNKKQFMPFLIENPLFVFVGGSVNAVRTENKRKVSDVVDILMFFGEFIKNQEKSIKLIERLLGGNPGLHDNKGREIFRDAYKYLNSKPINHSETYRDILSVVFNSNIPNAEMHIENLKGVSGEIGIRIGANDYFGVINVGDDSKLLKLCDDNGLSTGEKDFSESLFKKINDNNSNVNILIGSKKFMEGWSCWRVSTMGLMNVGRTEGSEIIQLFGRGVRLKGYNFSLKRSSVFKREKEGEKFIVPKHISLLETLNIFGIRADYMKQFKEYLEEEGIQTDSKPEFIEIPVLRNISLNTNKLKTLKVKDGLDFKRQGAKPTINLINDGDIEQKIVLDWYPKIQYKSSNSNSTIDISFNAEKLTEKHLAFINMNEVFFALENYKNEKSWYNLNITKENLYLILKNFNWYELYIPKEEMELNDFSNFKKWQEIAIVLLKKYCEYFYKYQKSKWEAPYLQYSELKDDDANYIKEDKYVFTINEPEENESLINRLNQLKEQLELGSLDNIMNFSYGNFQVFEFEKHLYNPLIYIGKNSTELQVSPVNLNDGERDFIQDLREFYYSNKSFFDNKELYLIRNKSKSGIGFFEANNFYPDFIMWLIHDGNQYITFVDPKGIRNLKGLQDAKIQLYNKIKEIELKLKEEDESIVLNSFIISATPYTSVSHWGSKDEFESKNVLFQKDDKEIYIQKIFNNIII